MYRNLVAMFCAVLLMLLPVRSEHLSNATKVADLHLDNRNVGLRPLKVGEEFFGMHTLSPARHWPAVAFGSIRPAGVTWVALEPERDRFNWEPLDFWVAQAETHKVQFDYVFLNVPAWASTRPDEPCAGKRIGCAAPPNLDAWDNFVRALVTRYKGRIASYEMWNEPNAGGYWTGTPEQMVELAAHAYGIIKAVDPAALVTTPAASSTGWPLAHDAWMERYLTAGGGKYADVVAWHGYSGRNDRPALAPEQLLDQISQLRAVLARHDLARLPIWNTEGGWGRNEQLPDEKAQASFLMRWYLLQVTSGVARAYWYQWDNPSWGTLWRDPGGIAPAGHAYDEMRDWLAGTLAASPCRQRGATSLWTCDLEKARGLYRVAWSTGAELALPESDAVEANVSSRGAEQPSRGGSIMVGTTPVLLKMKTPEEPAQKTRP